MIYTHKHKNLIFDVFLAVFAEFSGSFSFWKIVGISLNIARNLGVKVDVVRPVINQVEWHDFLVKSIDTLKGSTCEGDHDICTVFQYDREDKRVPCISRKTMDSLWDCLIHYRESQGLEIYPGYKPLSRCSN